jgi:hypothetical protein
MPTQQFTELLQAQDTGATLTGLDVASTG